MKDFDARRLVLFTVAVLGSFVAFVSMETAVTRHANLLNTQRLTLPLDQGVPQLLLGRKSMADTWLRNTASASTAETWILGTSISLIGLDPCRLTNAASFARYGTEFADMLLWAEQAAQANQKVRTLIVELSLGEPHAPPPDNSGLRAKTFLLSLQEIAAVGERPVPGARHQSCASTFVHRPGPPPPIKMLTSEQLATRSGIVLEAAAKLARWCAAADERRLILYVPPINPAAYQAQPGLDAMVVDMNNKLGTVVSELSHRNPGCRLSFHTPSAAEAMEDEWINYNHFWASFGDRLLEDMLGQPVRRARTTPN